MMTLNEYMENAGDTDATFALKVGLSRTQVSRIRRGISKPSVDAAFRISGVTKIPLEELLRPMSEESAA